MVNTDKHFLFLSDLLGRRVVNSDNGQVIGRVTDLIAIPKEVYHELSKLEISSGIINRIRIFIPWSRVETFEQPVKYLKVKTNGFPESGLPNEQEIFLKKTVLDHQIVDISGGKVVRVNDLHLLKENNKVWVVHVDIGFRGILRRLGWEKIFNRIAEWLFSYKLHDKFVSWKYVQPLPQSKEGSSPVWRLKIAYQHLTNLHPADLADIIADVSRNEREAIFFSLEPSLAAETMAELPPKLQKSLIESVDRNRCREIILEMPPDKAADLLNQLTRRKTEEILKHLPANESENIRKLLAQPEDTAGALMTTDYITFPGELTAGEAMVRLKDLAKNISAVYYIYVADQTNTLLGVITLRRLLTVPDHVLLKEVMHTKVIKVKETVTNERITRLFLKYNFGAVPVVDSHNRLKGIIMLKDALGTS